MLLQLIIIEMRKFYLVQVFRSGDWFNLEGLCPVKCGDHPGFLIVKWQKHSYSDTIRLKYKTNSLRVDSKFAKQHFNDKLSFHTDQELGNS